MSQTFCWGYEKDNGPSVWPVHYAAAAGHQQSPIDIVTKDAIYFSELNETPLTIQYETESEVNITNNGHSIMAHMTQNSVITGGPLKHKYKLEQFHLHWGNCSDHGSEHTIDGKCYAAELHLVHWNCDKYKNFAEAVDKEDGLAVIGVMIKAGAENENFKLMSESASSVQQPGTKCCVTKNFNAKSLLPVDTSDYWTYPGSLTTPPCYESVTWILLREPVEYSEDELSALRLLNEAEHGGKTQCIVNNFRPPLPLYDRKVKCSYPHKTITKC